MRSCRIRHALGIALAIGIVVGGASTAAASSARRTSGLPKSTNGASSMHVWLDDAPGARMEATITVTRPPSVSALYFWALQVTFVDSKGLVVGGAHIGLQWNPRHPGSGAVNFGGYDAAGLELQGSVSRLPSAARNENTRDFAWRSGAAYRLSIFKTGEGWTGAVTDVASGTVTEVRTLTIKAAAIRGAVLFSEVFASCDAPRTEVLWTGITLPATVTYQSMEAGGCTNTEQRAVGGGLTQRTNANRTVLDRARVVQGA